MFMKERTIILIIISIFLGCYYIPWAHPIIRQAGLEALLMLHGYAREHILTCPLSRPFLLPVPLPYSSHSPQF